MASIISIVYQPEDQKYEDHQADYIRVPVEQAHLIANHGIEGDQKAGHNPIRQLNLISSEWLVEQSARGYRSGPGQWGEQITISGVAVETLPAGTRLRLGAEAWIEITKQRTGCDRLEAAQRKSIEGVGPIGAMAKVITGGMIKIGNPVTVLKAEERAETTLIMD